MTDQEFKEAMKNLDDTSTRPDEPGWHEDDAASSMLNSFLPVGEIAPVRALLGILGLIACELGAITDQLVRQNELRVERGRVLDSIHDMLNTKTT